jgi:oligoendopeptidase F
MRAKFTIVPVIILSICMMTKAQNLERQNVEPKYKWNLTDIFKNENDWLKSRDNIEQSISKVEKYKGHLGESAHTLLEAMQTFFIMEKEFSRLSDYAGMHRDEDLNISKNQALVQQATALGTEIAEKTSFISPEILRIDRSRIEKFFSEEKGLADYKPFLEDIIRQKAHTLSETDEVILASFGLAADAPSNVYNIFTNAEMPFAKVTLTGGEEVKLTPAAFTRYRSVQNREDRKNVFASFFKNLGQFQNTIGANLAGKVKTDYTYAKDRKFTSTVEYSLFANNIPVPVYQNLVDQIHASLPILHRFLALKKKMLGVDTLHYYDLYAPIVKKTDLKFTIEEGKAIILNALKPLGAEYHATLMTAMDSNWIDFMPTVGKKSGAYSSGASYDVHPYVLMNWNNDYESVTTLAHELGHAMHSNFSNRYQPYPKSNYPIFVAEIASTLNENLLNNYMVQHAKTDDEKLSLLGNYLELLRLTIFRQTLFAEFELEIHKLVEAGKPVTGEGMSEIYLKLVKTYYGDDQGVCVVDPYITHEWAYIPHFIDYTYYVYQYSTSLIYSTAIAEKVMNEGQPAVEKYFNILKGGNSEYPIDLIKKAGIDPLSAEPFTLAMKRMNSVMDQIEELLNRKK